MPNSTGSDFKLNHYPPAGPGGPTHLVERGGAHADTCGVARDAGCSSQSPNSRRTLRSTACRVTPDGLPGNCYASPVGRGCAINLGSCRAIQQTDVRLAISSAPRYVTIPLCRKV